MVISFRSNKHMISYDIRNGAVRMDPKIGIQPGAAMGVVMALGSLGHFRSGIPLALSCPRMVVPHIVPHNHPSPYRP